jgi:hypothetical protein
MFEFMSTNLIWWSGIAIETVILLRGVMTGLLRKYPLFYTYIACVLVKEIIGRLTYRFAYELYEPTYWPAELATILASYAVIIEIFRWSVRHNPGIRRLTQNTLLSVFAFTVAYAGSDFIHGSFGSFSAATLELSRDLRYVEAGILLVMMWLFVRYQITLGRNRLGVMVGYSFWVGVNVMNLAFWFLPGNESSPLLRGLLPATYLMTLIIWSVALWSPQPEPVRPSATEIERDYEFLAGKTRAILERTSSQIARIMKP